MMSDLLCKGITLKNKNCKKKALKDSLFCTDHKDKFKLEKPEECLICCEDLKQEYRPLSCSHWMHRKCILNWGKPICPVCRSTIKIYSHEKKRIEHKEGEEDSSPFVFLNFLLDYFIPIYINSEEIQEEDEELTNNILSDSGIFN